LPISRHNKLIRKYQKINHPVLFTFTGISGPDVSTVKSGKANVIETKPEKDPHNRLSIYPDTATSNIQTETQRKISHLINHGLHERYFMTANKQNTRSSTNSNAMALRML
jgi:predicted flavoprotein YhiN